MQAWQMLQGLQFHILREARRKNELPIPKEHAYRAPKSTCCCFDRLPLQEAALQNYMSAFLVNCPRMAYSGAK